MKKEEEDMTLMEKINTREERRLQRRRLAADKLKKLRAKQLREKAKNRQIFGIKTY